MTKAKKPTPGKTKTVKKSPPRKPTRRVQVMTLLNISHQTYNRYKKRPDYPGDDSPDDVLTKWHEGNQSGRGRPPKIRTDNEVSQINEMHHLRAEKLRTDIEKNEIAAGKHIEKVIAEYRDKMIKAVNGGLDILFREIRRLDLDPDQLKRLSEAAKDAGERIRRETE